MCPKKRSQISESMGQNFDMSKIPMFRIFDIISDYAKKNRNIKDLIYAVKFILKNSKCVDNKNVNVFEFIILTAEAFGINYSSFMAAE